MTPQQIVRAAIPASTEAQCDYVLWSITPFPIGRVTAKSLYKAASRVRRAFEHKRVLCEFCDNEVTHGEYLCSRCSGSLSSNLKLRGDAPQAQRPSGEAANLSAELGAGN